jgi:hypothetical protein
MNADWLTILIAAAGCAILLTSGIMSAIASERQTEIRPGLAHAGLAVAYFTVLFLGLACIGKLVVEGVLS